MRGAFALVLVCACAGMADSTYAGQLASCVNRSQTQVEADSCRKEVDARWCVVDGAPGGCSRDGGKP